MLLYNFYYIFVFLYIFGYFNSYIYSFDNNYEKILLTQNNFVSIKNTINKDTRIKFIEDITVLSDDTKDFYIIIDSNGGDVFEGQKIIDQIKFLQANNIHIKCVALIAYSMAFHIFQSCNERIIYESSKLMSHQLKLSINDIEIYKLKNYLEMIYNINENLDEIISKRLNVDIKMYREKIYNEWWIDGKQIIKEKLADKIVYIGCDTNLYNNKGIYNDDIKLESKNILLQINNKKKCPL